MFKLDNFGVTLFVSFSYKKLLQCSFYENLKDWCKNRFKIQKSLCFTTKSLCTNSKFQTQLSRKLQRFRTCRKDKKCSIFHELSEYIFFHMIINYLSSKSNDSPIIIKNNFLFWNLYRSLKDHSSKLQPYEKMIYSERSWKMEHFLFLRHVLNRCSFRDNCVWNFEFVYKFFVVIHKLFWIFCGKIDFCINFLNFHSINIVAVFYS
jgi:hypothetical protein